MKKRFNVVSKGTPKQHTIKDTPTTVQKMLKLAQASMYFTINRPSQDEKTTTL